MYFSFDLNFKLLDFETSILLRTESISKILSKIQKKCNILFNHKWFCLLIDFTKLILILN